MKIDEIDKLIINVPIKERLLRCQLESAKRFNPNKPIVYPEEYYKNNATNYELELIALRSVLVKELSVGVTEEDWFYKILKLLRTKDFFNLKKTSLDKVITQLLFQQIETQIDYKILYYRYNFFFNYIDENLNMKEEFKKKFKVNYVDFVNVSIFISILLPNNNISAFKNIYDMFFTENERKALKQITIDRNLFINKYKKIYENINYNRNKFFDLNLLVQFPIIKYNNETYIPYAPYIPYSSTRSLMFRLTKNNNNLRAKIGKNIMEDYLYYLLTNSLVTKDFNINKEFKYDKDNKLSSDIILFSDKEVLFIEAKMFNQSISLRANEYNEIKVVQDRISDAIIQVLTNIHGFKKGKMKNKIKLDSNVECYGTVVLYDDLYISQDNIYEKAFKKSVIKGYDFSKKFINNNIKIYSLTILENNLNVYGGNIFELLKGKKIESPENRLINFKDVYYKLINLDEKELLERIKINKKRLNKKFDV